MVHVKLSALRHKFVLVLNVKQLAQVYKDERLVIKLVLQNAQVQMLLLVIIVWQLAQVYKDERLVIILVLQHAKVQKMLLVMHV